MKTKTKILKVFAIIAIFLASSHLMAQTLPLNTITQTVCVNTLAEPYEVVNNVGSTYSWSIIDQATGLAPPAGVADIIPTANDWFINIDWTTVGTYELSLVETDVATTCNSAPIVLTITVEDNANAPVAINPAPICLNDPNPTMTATTGGGTGNSVFTWYDDAALTSQVGTGATYTDPILYPIDGPYDYWVTEKSTNGCEGVAIQVTITVTPLPTAPTLANLNYQACFGDDPLTYPLMTAVGAGSNFNWYDVDPAITSGAIALATGISTYTSTETNPSPPGGYLYWVEEVVGSCISPATPFTFTIHATPASPLVTPLIAGLPAITICEGETPANFVATTGGAAGTFTWYDVDPLLNPAAVSIGNGTPFILTPTAPNTYNYWLTETDPITSCISNPSTATFIINPLPLVPTVTSSSSFTICLNEPNPTFTAAPDPASTGTNNFNWYDVDPVVNPGATPIATLVNTFQPIQTGVSTTDYWLVETNSVTGCEGLPVLFTFEIINLPAVPTISSNPVEICYGDANPPITPTGSNLVWYDIDPVANPGAVAVGNGTFTPPPSAAGNATTVTTYSYWVNDQPGTCVSLPLQVDLQINPLPTPGPIWHN